MTENSLPPPAAPQLRFLAGAAFIVLAVLAVYWPVWRGEFVWDDRLLVDRNPLVTGKLDLRSVWLGTDFPLSLVAFWLEWLAWGKSAAGYHVVNLVLHALGAVLFWRVLVRLQIPAAWFAAMLFAVHPVGAATAAWISEMKNTLSLVFFLMSLWWYLGAEALREEQPDTAAPRIQYALSLGAFLLALLAKTTTVMLPVVLLGCAWWRRGRITLRDGLRTTPYFACSLGFGLLSIWFQKHQAMADVSVQTEGFFGRLAGAGWAVWFYLAKAVAPIQLSMIYPRWTIDAGSPVAWLPLVLLVVVVAAFWRFRRTWGRPALFALGGFVVMLFPTLGFFDMYWLALSRVSDHLQYLALLPLIAFVAAAWNSVPNRDVRIAGAAALLFIFSTLTMQRARTIARDETLWRDTLAKNPAAWTAHNNLGCILAEQNQLDAAIEHFEASLQVQPRNAQAHANLARALALQNHLAEAETQLQAALAIKPDDADIHRSAAGVLAAEGKFPAALQHLRDCLRLEPDVETRLQFAGLLFQTRNFNEAVIQYRQVLALKPDLIEALNNLAWMLATCPDPSVRNGVEAVRAAEHAGQLTRFEDPVPLGTLAAGYAEAGRFEEAVATAQKAIDLATAAGNSRFADINRQLMKSYRAGKAWHEQAP